MKAIRRLALAAALVAAPTAAHAEWQAVEVVKTYSISGKTGPELYESIGRKGPKAIGGARAIAHTNFKLTWSRKYVPKDGTCVLTRAAPKLVITYTLPKPAGKLPPPVDRNWETFISGIRAHEKVHGDFIRRMVREIEAATVGMSVADDPKCVKIRSELTRRLTAIYQAYKQRNRDFERSEMSNGGNVHRLILAFVNGG